MKNLKFLFVALSLLSFKSYAQDGYTISIDVSNAKSKMLQFSYYHGTTTKPTLVDSVLIDQPQQHIEFKSKKKIFGGIYRLNFKEGSKSNSIDIAVDNGAALHFNLADTNLLKMTTDDKMNQLFFSYQMINAGGRGNDQTQSLNLLSKNYPQSVAALYAKLELKKMEAYAKGQDAANRPFRDAYFTAIDMQDKRLQFLPDTYSFLNTYFSLLPFNNKNYQEGVDLLLKNSDCSNTNYIFYLTWIFKNITFLQRYNLNNTFRYVYTTYLDKEPCKTDNPVLYARTTADYKELDALVVGNTIPDFDMQDSIGNLYSIKSLLTKSKYTFIIFYDPDCTHCQEIVPQVSKYFDSANFDKGLVQKISFANAFDFKDWQKFLKNGKLENWLNVKPKTGDQSYMINLKIYSNPNFLLIDDKGIIRLKKFDRESIHAILKGE